MKRIHRMAQAIKIRDTCPGEFLEQHLYYVWSWSIGSTIKYGARIKFIENRTRRRHSRDLLMSPGGGGGYEIDDTQ